MKIVLNSLLMIALLLLTAAGIAGFGGSARSQECDIGICKSAEGAGDLLFPFTTDHGGVIDEFDLIPTEAMGACILLGFDDSSNLSVFEDPISGWKLDHIECDTTGITFETVDGGVVLNCTDPNNASGSCTFFNVPGEIVSNIPTLSQWGMIAAAAGLVLIGVFFAFRRKRAQAV